PVTPATKTHRHASLIVAPCFGPLELREMPLGLLGREPRKISGFVIPTSRRCGPKALHGHDLFASLEEINGIAFFESDDRFLPVPAPGLHSGAAYTTQLSSHDQRVDVGHGHLEETFHCLPD